MTWLAIIAALGLVFWLLSFFGRNPKIKSDAQLQLASKLHWRRINATKTFHPKYHKYILEAKAVDDEIERRRLLRELPEMMKMTSEITAAALAVREISAGWEQLSRQNSQYYLGYLYGLKNAQCSLHKVEPALYFSPAYEETRRIFGLSDSPEDFVQEKFFREMRTEQGFKGAGDGNDDGKNVLILPMTENFPKFRSSRRPS